MRDHTALVLLVAAAALLAAGSVMPNWTISLLSVALAFGIVVLGMLLLMRTGLVSFGQGLYYCLGAYAAGAPEQLARNLDWQWLRAIVALGAGSDLLVMLFSAVLVTGVVSGILGLLMARYRDIFFAMLSLAFSMILYGLLVKTSALGSTDGFNVAVKTIAGFTPAETAQRYSLFATACVTAAIAVLGMHFYLRSHFGRLAGAIRDNELRVEYMGASVRRTIHLNYVISAVLAGLGGALMAANIGHVDPETTANWTVSGEFVFIAILSGTGSVLAPFLGAAIFETVRTFAYEYSPNTWQMVLGATMLLVIMFLPGGLWSVFRRRRAVTS